MNFMNTTDAVFSGGEALNTKAVTDGESMFYGGNNNLIGQPGKRRNIETPTGNIVTTTRTLSGQPKFSSMITGKPFQPKTQLPTIPSSYLHIRIIQNPSLIFPFFLGPVISC